MSVHDLTKTPRETSGHDGPGPRRETPEDRRVPLFVEELTGTLSVHAQYVLHGNVDDLHLVRPRGTDSHHGLVTVVWNSLRAQGYRALVRYDQIDGFRVAGPRSGPDLDIVRHLLAESGPTALPRVGRSARTSPLLEVVPQFQELVRGWAQRRAVSASTQEAGPLRVALLVDHAGRLPTDPGRLSEAERDFFLACLKLAGSAEPLAPDPAAALAMPEHPAPPALFNPVIWLTPGERDLPSWFVSGSNRIRRIAVPEPDADERRRMARLLEREHARESGRVRRADVPGAETATTGGAPSRTTSRGPRRA